MEQWGVDWVKFEKPCIFSYFWEDPVYVSLKSAIVQHRSQTPGPELDLKKQVWTNQSPAWAALVCDWSKLPTSRQAPGLGFDFCGELCNFLGLHIQGLPKNNWKYRVFQIWPNLLLMNLTLHNLSPTVNIQSVLLICLVWCILDFIGCRAFYLFPIHTFINTWCRKTSA